MLPFASLQVVLRQPESTAESRAVSAAALTCDIVSRICPLDDLPLYANELRCGTTLPVGSVEFVRAALATAGVPEPENMSYPRVLRPFLRRNVRLTTATKVLEPSFVKPVATKVFTGFVYHPALPRDAYSEHDLEQLDVFLALAADAPVWTSEPVRFLCEHRHYILHGRILGSVRYDPDGAEDAPSPDVDQILAAITGMQAMKDCPVSYALDTGVLADGTTALVEVNDGWALGLYGRALSAKDYLALLTARWQQLVGATTILPSSAA